MNRDGPFQGSRKFLLRVVNLKHQYLMLSVNRPPEWAEGMRGMSHRTENAGQSSIFSCKVITPW